MEGSLSDPNQSAYLLILILSPPTLPKELYFFYGLFDQIQNTPDD